MDKLAELPLAGGSATNSQVPTPTDTASGGVSRGPSALPRDSEREGRRKNSTGSTPAFSTAWMPQGGPGSQGISYGVPRWQPRPATFGHLVHGHCHCRGDMRDTVSSRGRHVSQAVWFAQRSGPQRLNASCELAARPEAMPRDRRLATWNDVGRHRLHCSNRNKASSARLTPVV
jgi:hypothetical protein